MTDQRRDPQGRFRQPHALEPALDALRDKHTAAAARIGLLHSPSRSWDPEQADIDRAFRQIGFAHRPTD